MKKSLIFAGILAIGFANAQEGNVGINTDQPKATLDIQPNATNLVGTTNQGILAPRLSKTRVANIETPVQGTLVYVLDENSTEYPNSLISAYTGADTKVAKITEKGYYFYNGTEWVKAGVSEKGNEWILTDEYFDKTNTYKTNVYSFLNSKTHNDGSYGAHIMLNKNINSGTLTTDYSVFKYDTLTNTKVSSTSLSGDRGINFSSSNFQLGYLDFQTQDISGYELRMIAFDRTKDTLPNNDQEGKQLKIFSVNRESSSKTNLFEFNLDGDKTSFSNPNLDYVFGEKGFSLLSKKAVNSDEIGNYPYFTLNTKDGVSNTGNNTYIAWSLNRHSKEGWKGTTNRLQKTVDTQSMGFIDFGINGITNEVATNNGLGFGYNNTVHAVIRESGNMGIGTITPSEKLEVDGKIKTSSLAQSGAGDRVVYADENGVLKTGVSAAANIKLATANNVECTEANTGTMNFGSVTINGKATEAFGFCMKNSTGEYKWYYIYGGAGITTGSGAFGSNL